MDFLFEDSFKINTDSILGKRKMKNSILIRKKQIEQIKKRKISKKKSVCFDTYCKKYDGMRALSVAFEELVITYLFKSGINSLWFFEFLDNKINLLKIQQNHINQISRKELIDALIFKCNDLLNRFMQNNMNQQQFTPILPEGGGLNYRLENIKHYPECLDLIHFLEMQKKLKIINKAGSDFPSMAFSKPAIIRRLKFSFRNNIILDTSNKYGKIILFNKFI